MPYADERELVGEIRRLTHAASPVWTTKSPYHMSQTAIERNVTTDEISYRKL